MDPKKLVEFIKKFICTKLQATYKDAKKAKTWQSQND